MKVFDTLIKVSKSSINEKIFNVKREDLEKELQGQELQEAIALLPTEDEQNFMDVFKSNIAGLERLQRKMSVCLDVEVLELEENLIKYEYAKNIYEIREPKNAFKICTELEKGKIEAFTEVCKQKCFYENNELIEDIKKDGAIKLDALNLAIKICDKFFFQTFLQ